MMKNKPRLSSQFLRAANLLLLVATCCHAGVISPENPMLVSVDTSQLHRHLLRSTCIIPVEPGPLTLWYPKWIPGIHGPGEQIRNMGGLQIVTEDGEPIAWRRDPDDLYRFDVVIPEETEAIRVSLTYIANQPTRVSVGVDTYGNAALFAINFNTCVVYPDGVPSDELPIELTITLPASWQFGTSLSLKESGAGSWTSDLTTLERLIDSPLIAGRHYRKLEIETPGFPPTRMHFVSEASDALAFDDDLVTQYHQLMQATKELFGGAPYDAYDFLVVCSDEVPGMGLEHHASSLNGIDEDALTDLKKREGRPATLLPHELVHAWCGKYRRPEGMYRRNYHAGKQTNLLWVYEGLTQYLGHVLSVRSGLMPFDDHLDHLAGRVGYLVNRAGRNWRSLEDTAVSAYTLRGGSERWNDLRRNQDYYDEGALFWMEVDVRIRQASDGKLSLDNFVQRFFAVPENRTAYVKTFTQDELVATLNEIQPGDWNALIEQRILRAQTSLPLDAITQAGYEFRFSPERSEIIQRREKERGVVDASFSIGLSAKQDGEITTVIPGTVADAAGVAEGMQLAGVNMMKFDGDRLREALRAAQETGRIELLLLDGDRFAVKTIDFQGGPKYPSLVPREGKTDYLKEIFTPPSE